MIDMDIAAEMWKSGMSQAKIGKHFGMTPGQIAGIFGRNRLMFPKRNDKLERLEAEITDALFASIKDDERKTINQTRKPANAIRKMFHEAYQPAIPQEPTLTAKEYDQSRLPGYTLWELDARGCKYPLNDGSPYRFCGENRYQMKPWCKAHHERVWRAQ
jgi:GcrA cell cycle regulator